MRTYETTFALDARLEEADVEKELNKVLKIIGDASGSVAKSDRWGVRRLAYEIKGRIQGNFFHVVHTSPASVPIELERTFRLNESVLRQLTVVIPPKVSKAREAAAERAAHLAEVAAAVPAE